MARFYRDDNDQTLVSPEGMRPDFTTIARVATGAAITEQSIASMNVAANRTSDGNTLLVRVTQIGADRKSTRLNSSH